MKCRHQVMLWSVMVPFFAVRAATFTVTNTADSGVGTLRSAITNANQAGGGTHFITFNLPAPYTIAPVTSLPLLTNSAWINGATQPGYTGAPIVQLSGAPGIIHGLHIQSRGGGVRGLQISGFTNGTGIILDGPTNTIAGCWIISNNSGVSTYPFASNALIGGFVVSNRNVISGNFIGVSLAGGGVGHHVLAGNFIGTDPAGKAAMPNQSGGVFVSLPACTIGGSTTNARNIISGNVNRGVYLGPGAVRISVAGNFIGTDVTGTNALANAGSGIQSFHTVSNTIGGATAAHGNIISGNTQEGVTIYGTNSTFTTVQNNRVGLDINGKAVPNGTGGLNSPGISIIGSSNIVLFNAVSGNIGPGVRIGFGQGNILAGNIIGLDPSGSYAVSNRNEGVLCDSSASSNVIGSALFRNVISGNGQNGVRLSGVDIVGNVIAGNYIGTDITGTNAVPNTFNGVLIDNAPLSVIGNASAGNLISGNGSAGIQISGTNAWGAMVDGNFIGLDVNGAAAISNASVGISVIAAPGARIGTIERNVIAASGVAGISLGGISSGSSIIAGNYIGLGTNGVTALGNGIGISLNAVSHDCRITNNVVSGNLLSGIRVDLSTSNIVIAGNIVGLSGSGSSPVPNSGPGILLTLSGGVHIGGVSSAERNLISGNAGPGIRVNACRTNGAVIIEGNIIGLNAAGTSAIGNGGDGIEGLSSLGVRVGGPTIASRNIISGNSNGVFLASDNDRWWISYNSIGLDASGMTARSNLWEGVRLHGSCESNLVENNYIAGNGGHGVLVRGGGYRNAIRVNRIGLGAAIGLPIPNGGDGVAIENSVESLVGGYSAADGNIIAYNKGCGVSVVTQTSVPGYGNLLLANLIYSNAAQAIDLNRDGVTANDPAPDADNDSANNNQNYPSLFYASHHATNVSGRLVSGNENYRLEFFALTPVSGMVFVGTAQHYNPAPGTGAFSFAFSKTIPTGSVILATATSGDGTSEFSPAIPMTDLDDTDGDNMPDWWEIANGLNEGVSNAVSDDADADGVPDVQEWIADTMANDAASYLAIVEMEKEEAWTLFVPSSGTRRYSLESTPSPTSTIWQVVQSDVPGNGSLLGLNHITAQPNHHYRVTAKRP